MFAEQLLQITRRTRGLAAGALTASMAASTAAYAQSGDPTSPPAAVAKVFKDRVITDDTPTTGTGRITGTVTDPQGAVIPNATITLTDIAGATTRGTTTDSEGVYH